MSVITSPAFWAPVTIRLPGDDGALEIIQCRGRFKRLKKSERIDLDRRVRCNSMTPDTRELLRKALAENVMPITDRERREIEADIAAEFISDLDVLKLVLVDWDFKTKQGEFIPFTPANLEQYSEEIDGFDAAFVSGYFDAMRKASQPGEVEKNSGRQSSTT